MSRVWVVVPYRPEVGWRDRALEHTLDWWTRKYPAYEVVVGMGADAGAWCKATAVADGLRSITGGILIVADADVMSDGVGLAVEAVQSGAAQWAVPHYRVNRLAPLATEALYAGAGLPDQPALTRRRHHSHQRPPTASSPDVERSYVGVVGGGLVVLPRALYDRVPLDPRFLGYGQEDASWGLALRSQAGEPFRGTAPLWHLWHPPQERSKVPGIGSPENHALYNRYLRAATPPDMAALLQEIPRVD